MITVIYLLSHLFLLFLSGCWWDDWTFMSHNVGIINAVASQSGRPEWNLLIPFCWSLPNNGRFLIFFLYYLDALFVFDALKNSTLFNEKDSLLITLLFVIIPNNEARLLISNFSYTVGLFVFFLSMCLFMRWNKERNVMLRAGLLILFFISFILNSLMAYYYILFVYLFVIEMRRLGKISFRNIFLSIRNVLLHYPDFFVLPFVYLIINKTFFPTSGSFASYNTFDLYSMLKAVYYIPVSLVKDLMGIFENWFNGFNSVSVLIIVVVIVYMIRNGKERFDYYKSSNYYLWVILFAVAVFVLALVPYVLIRVDDIALNGVQGRDSILIPLGVAMLLFGIFSFTRGKFKYIIYIFVLVLGMVEYNLLYLEWQKDYYYQLAMENLLSVEVIKDNDTFFLADMNESDVGGQRFYSLNTNSYNVFNDETRFFIPKVSNLYLLEDEKALNDTIVALDYANMMRDYRPDDYYLDAVIIYECDLSDYETLKLKMYEMSDKEKFEESISKLGSLEVYVVDDDFTIKLLDEVDKGLVRNDEDVVSLLEEYNNK